MKYINNMNMSRSNQGSNNQTSTSHKMGHRILAQGVLMSNDTWATRLNNNDLIIGPSGAGKTRGYVIPNILQCNESLIVADTKGNLARKLGPILRQNGYKVLHINMKNLYDSDGYNPLDFIRYDAERQEYNEQDILTIANALCPTQTEKDPYWENEARVYLSALISYTLECLPEEEHTLNVVMDLARGMSGGTTYALLDEVLMTRPNSYVARTYREFQGMRTADKTEACILSFLTEHLHTVSTGGCNHVYTRPNRLNFADLGREHAAVFLSISDTDRSMDGLVSLLYTQALQCLCRSADEDYPDSRLPVPVRLILDDFATNAFVPDFDKIISVIRSREIMVSILLQSITQLEGLYGSAKAQTIINNCDNLLYLGGQDLETARQISVKANRTVDSILNMPLTEAYLFTRGTCGRRVRPYDLTCHPMYLYLPEAAAQASQVPGAAASQDRPQSERP